MTDLDREELKDELDADVSLAVAIVARSVVGGTDAPDATVAAVFTEIQARKRDERWPTSLVDPLRDALLEALGDGSHLDKLHQRVQDVSTAVDEIKPR